MLTAHKTPLDSDPAHWLSGQLNQHVIASLLQLRQARPALFRHGDYLPLSAQGPGEDHLILFARLDSTHALMVIAPRLALKLPDNAGESDQTAPSASTTIALTAPLSHRRYRNILSGEVMFVTDQITLAATDTGLPLILSSE